MPIVTMHVPLLLMPMTSNVINCWISMQNLSSDGIPKARSNHHEPAKENLPARDADGPIKDRKMHGQILQASGLPGQHNSNVQARDLLSLTSTLNPRLQCAYFLVHKTVLDKFLEVKFVFFDTTLVCM